MEKTVNLEGIAMAGLNAFVHVIESPSSHDLLSERTEGRVLSESLQIADIPHRYNLAADRATLMVALEDRLIEKWEQTKKLPILHLSMHGNEEGVALTSGEYIFWHDLREILMPLVRVMRGSLLVCMSTCFGSNGCRMAMYTDSEPHFWALVGHTGKAGWADAAIAYSSFYHLLFKGLDIATCVNSMRIASGDHFFVLHDGAKVKAGWQVYLQQQQQQINTGLAHAATKLA